jgi:SAM-dependent methyltransferase
MADTGRCQLCLRFTWLEPLLDLGSQPLAERDDGNRYPLALVQCPECGLIQLSYAVDRHEVFPLDHPYATGNTRAMRGHFAGLAARALQLLDDQDLIIDIGANDGTFLAAVRRAMPSARVLGIEPTNQARGCRAKSVPVEQAFWSSRLAASVAGSRGQAQVITAANVLAHCDDPHDFVTGVAAALAPGGTFITENHDAASVTGGLQIDTVYHEHLRFFTPATLGRLLEMHGFMVTETESIPTHGGSFRTYAKPRPPDLQSRANAARDQLCRLLEIASEDGPVWGIGAATRATPLIHFAGLERWIHAIAEVPGSGKIGSRMPGTQIRVADEAEMITARPDYAVLFAWHVASDIVPKLRAAGFEGKIIIPLPHPRIYRG